MTDLEYPTFSEAFRRVITAFRLKLKAAEIDELTRTYFRMMTAYELDAVLAAGRVCIGKYRTFPKAADWLTELGPTTTRGCPEDLRHMSADELDVFEQAARTRYEDLPCACGACVHAGMTDRPLRFVPTLDGESYERAYNPRTGRVELAGHWAHGAELARWYAARDAFFALAPKTPAFFALVEALTIRDGELVGAGAREPGMEG